MSTEISNALIEDLQLEGALLHLIVDLHPDHLTGEELVLKMALDPRKDDGQAEKVEFALDGLLRSGLVRDGGGTIAPTHAALRCVELLID